MRPTCASFVIVGTSSSSLSSLDSSLSADILIILLVCIAYVQNVNKTAGFSARRHQVTHSASDEIADWPKMIQIATECTRDPRCSLDPGPSWVLPRAPRARASQLSRGGRERVRKEERKKK